MANKKVLHKRSNIEGKAPTTDQLDFGELAINYNAGNEQLYIKNSDNAIVGLIGQSGGGEIISVTASGESPLSLSSTTSSSGAVTISGSVDLSNYATTSSVPTKTSDLTNDSGFITSSALSGYATTSDLDAKQDKLTAGDNITISDSTISATDTTYSEATTSSAGLMSASDKGTLDSLSSNAVIDVIASGTSPLTLEGSVADGVAAITGSVDLSNYLNTTSDVYVKDIVFKTDSVSGKQLPVNFDRVGEEEIDKSYVVYTVYGHVDLSNYLNMTSDAYARNIFFNTGSVRGKQLPVEFSVTINEEVDTSGFDYTVYGHVDLSDYAKSSDLPKYWNYYFFEGGSAESIVTIDGAEVSVPANTIVEGNFTTDITAIGTNNLKRIIIRGDVSLSICSSSSSSNTTLEEVDLTFSPSYSRSFAYMFHNLRGLKRLRVSGGQATSAYYMCYYVGSSTNEGCEIDIKGMDFSQMTSSNGASCLCQRAKIASIDLSGHTFNGSAYDMFYGATVGSADVSGCTFGENAHRMFYNATVGSANVSGCTFSGDAYYMFYNATVGNADVSGCTFSGSAYDMFYGATVNSADVSGCTFGGSAYYMFYGATVGSANVSGCTFSGDAGCMFYQAKEVCSADVSGCTFKDVAWSMFCETTVGYANVSGCTFSGTDSDALFRNSTVGSADLSGCTFENDISQMFYYAIVGSVNLSGCDLSGLSVTSSSSVWDGATINSINLNGVTLPTAEASNYYFVNSINRATTIGAIFGDFGEITSEDDFTFDNLELRRESTVAILSALEPVKRGTYYISISSYSGARLSDADVALATKKGWVVTY